MQKLVVNAIEAEARNIWIEVDLQSLRLEVRDDGCGISPHDMFHIGQKNTTSKVGSKLSTEAENPEYKGESLASLAQISELRITTKSAAYSQESFKRIKGGKVEEFVHRLTKKGVQGTCVQLRDIFFNLPVRKKQMLSDKTWKAQLRHLLIRRLQRFALLYPAKAVVLFEAEAKKPLYKFNSCATLKAAFQQTFGLGFHLVPLREQSNGGEFALHGFVGDTKELCATNRIQFVYLNGKVVETPKFVQRQIDTVFARATRLLDAKRVSGYPVYVVHIVCSPNKFDIAFNEALPVVSFHDWQTLAREVEAVFSTALGITVETQAESIGASIVASSRRRDKRKEKLSVLKRRQFSRAGRCDLGSSSSSGFKATRVPKEAFSECRVLSQVSNKFILIKHRNLLLCLDQHAMHERIRLETFQKEIEEKKQLASMIGIAQAKCSVSLGDDEFQLLKARHKHMQRWGWGWDVVDEDAKLLLVHHVPTVFKNRLDSVSHFRAFLHDQTNATPKSIKQAITTRSCRGAIKFGDELTMSQCVSLVRQLSECNNPFQCAHGRPSCVPLIYL